MNTSRGDDWLIVYQQQATIARKIDDGDIGRVLTYSSAPNPTIRSDIRSDIVSQMVAYSHP
jgi:hypothetical protein